MINTILVFFLEVICFNNVANQVLAFIHLAKFWREVVLKLAKFRAGVLAKYNNVFLCLQRIIWSYPT